MDDSEAGGQTEERQSTMEATRRQEKTIGDKELRITSTRGFYILCISMTFYRPTRVVVLFAV